MRVIPVIVACPLFLQNLDTTVMATALPSMAKSLGVPVLDLNLAITSYLLSLAIFLPASAWMAGRFGARRVFCAAVILFSLSSALCALAGSLSQLLLRDVRDVRAGDAQGLDVRGALSRRTLHIDDDGDPQHIGLRGDPPGSHAPCNRNGGDDPAAVGRVGGGPRRHCGIGFQLLE